MDFKASNQLSYSLLLDLNVHKQLFYNPSPDLDMFGHILTVFELILWVYRAPAGRRR